ncbi:hypothetical protein [Thermogutta sp.]|uniref:hypothetical protein n=1 Tax=Thermogutta sp. TaxID=1962930 RepID=UPI0032201815
MMPKFWLQIAPLVTLGLFVGLAIYRYPNVNDRIWQMVQAKDRLVKEGTASRRAAFALSESQGEFSGGGSNTMTITGPRESPMIASRETISQPDVTNARISATGWNNLEISPIVAENRGDSGSKQGNGGLSRNADPNLEAVHALQITTAVPPRMAIAVPSSLVDPLRDSAGTQPNRAEPVPAESFGVARPSVAQRGSTGGASEVVSGEAETSRKSPRGVETPEDGGDVPQLVPIEGFRRRSKEDSERPPRVKFQMLDAQPSVARKMEQPPVVETDLPLVTIVKSPWFASEKPQRLPPVDQSLPAPQVLSPSEWIPTVPLYPSTGR